MAVTLVAVLFVCFRCRSGGGERSGGADRPEGAAGSSSAGSVEARRRHTATSGPQSQAIPVRVLDAQTGRAVVGVRVRLRDGSVTESATDAAGVIALDRRDVTAVAGLADAAWTLLSEPARADAEGVFVRYGFQTVEVEGSVRLEGATPTDLEPPSLERLEIDVIAVSPEDAEAPQPGALAELGSQEWRLRTWPRVRPVRASADGSFRIRAPLLGTTAVRARLAGWGTDWERVPSGTNPTVQIVLRRGARFLGCVTAAGNCTPIEHAYVSINTLQTMSADAFDALQLRAPGVGATARVNRRANRAVCRYRSSAWTAADGSFNALVTQPGDGHVVVVADGYRVLRRHVGAVEAADSSLSLQLSAAEDGGALTLCDSGAPLDGGTVRLSVVSWEDADLQVVLGELRIGRDGSIPTWWFDAGEVYSLYVTWVVDGSEHRERGLVAWRGQRSIEVTKLGQARFDDLMAERARDRPR